MLTAWEQTDMRTHATYPVNYHSITHSGHERLILPSIQEDSSVNYGRVAEGPEARKRWATLAEVPSILIVLPLSCVGMFFLMIMLTNPVEVHSPLKQHNLESRLENWEEWKHRFHDALHGTQHSVEELVNVTTDLIKNLSNMTFDDEDDSCEPIYLNHSFSYELLLSTDFRSLDADYFLINQGWDAQVNQFYCGVATSVAILNSFRGYLDLPVDQSYSPYPYATQHNLWNKCTAHKVIRRDRDYDGILQAPGGLGMDQVKLLLECNLPQNFTVTAHHVDPSKLSIDAMRQDLIGALQSSESRVMINYNRKKVHQVGGGHWSPLGSYSAARDAFLVLDVAKYRYPPAWITAELLYQSLSTFDTCGSWDYPAAQGELPATLQNPTTQEEFQEVLQLLGCEATRRGYIIVQKS